VSPVRARRRPRGQSRRPAQQHIAPAAHPGRSRALTLTPTRSHPSPRPVYSFGVVLWELLTRQRPYADMDVPVYLLMVNVGNGSLRLPPVPEADASRGLVALVERCLGQAPAERPAFMEILPVLEAEYRAARARIGSSGGGAATPGRSESAAAAPSAAAAAAAAAAAGAPRRGSLELPRAGALAAAAAAAGLRASLDMPRGGLAAPAGSGDLRASLEAPRSFYAGGTRDAATPSPFMAQHHQAQQQLFGPRFDAGSGGRRGGGEGASSGGDPAASPYLQLPDPLIASGLAAGGYGGPLSPLQQQMSNPNPPAARHRLAWQDSVPAAAPSPADLGRMGGGAATPSGGPSGGGSGPHHHGGRRRTLNRARSMPMPRHSSSWLDDEIDAALGAAAGAGDGSLASTADGGGGGGGEAGGGALGVCSGQWAVGWTDSNAGSDAASALDGGFSGWASPRAGAGAHHQQQHWAAAPAPWPGAPSPRAWQGQQQQPRTPGAVSPFAVGSPSQGSMMVMAMIGAAAAAQAAAAAARLPSLTLPLGAERDRSATPGSGAGGGGSGLPSPAPAFSALSGGGGGSGARLASPVYAPAPRGLGHAGSSAAPRGELPPLQVLQIGESSGAACLDAFGSPRATAGAPPPLGGAPNSAAMLLQRHDSVGRSRSPTASPRAGAAGVSPFQQYSRLPSPDCSGGGGGGGASGGGGGGGGAAAFHRHASSRLSVQGSYELPPPTWQGGTDAAGGGGGGPAAAPPPSGACTPPRQLLVPTKRHSLLRHESGREPPSGPASSAAPRGQSPFAMVPDNAAASATRVCGFNSPSTPRSPQAAPARLRLQQGPGAPPAAAAAAGDSAEQAVGSPTVRAGPLPSPFALMQQ
jgi:hypothetical protein